MKKILLAVDGSNHSQEAAWFLSHLAHNDQLDIVVLTVLPAALLRRGIGNANPIDELEEETFRANQAYMGTASLFEGANVRIRHLVRVGHAGETIVDVAKNLQSELIVVGAIGHSMLHRMLLGSTSDYVATHAECSVLVVRSTGLRDSGKQMRVVLGYEDTGPAQAALEEFSDFRWGAQADVDVVTMLAYGLEFSAAEPIHTDVERELASTSMDKACEQLRNVAPSVKGHLRANNHVGEGLVNFVESHHCDLLVVGETNRDNLGRVLMGSVSRYVLRHAPCSVWVTRNRMVHGYEKELPEQETTFM